jgi:signal peptidase
MTPLNWGRSHMKRTAVRAGKALQSLAALLAILALMALLALTVVPRLIGWQPVVVLSGSMEPALPVGGLVFLEPVHAEQVKAGDVISYRLGNSRVTHRVVEVATDGQGALAFRTKGDANNDADAGLVAASNVDSREVLTVPYLGKALNFIRSRTGFYALLALPALFVIGSSVLNIVTEIERQRRKAAV